MLPAKSAQVQGAAANAGSARVGMHLSMSLREGDSPRIHVRVVVGACPPLRSKGRSQPMAPDWTAYTEGGCKDELAGWGYVLTEGGDGVEDVQARVLDEGYGPVVVEEGHPAYIGATRPTNNTGELSAVAELMRALLEEQAMPPESNGVIRTDRQ